MEDPANPIPPSLWSSLNSWFTSTVFFILLNLMIATIVFTSNLPSSNPQQQKQSQQEENTQENQHNQNTQNTHQLPRSTSILHRLKSLNFYPQRPHQDSSQEPEYHPHPLEAAASQYVFNQPLEYQHFDYESTNPNQVYKIQQTEAHAEHVTESSDYYQFRQETGKDPTFGFNPTKEVTWGDTSFDFDPTRLEKGSQNGFELDPTRKEKWEDPRFNFDPTRNEVDSDNTGLGLGFDFDPTRQEKEKPAELGFETAEEGGESLDEVYSRLKRGGHDRTKSDGSIGKKPAANMKKSASLKLGFSSLEEEEVEARRPATVKGKTSGVREDDDVEVDSRADDFINKFKNDLKLQRIESIMRKGVNGNGMNSRGGGK